MKVNDSGDQRAVDENQPAVDLPAVLERIGGDEDLLKELVALYLDDEGRLLTEIAHALEVGDAAGIRRAAHTLKGAVSNFCAPRAQAAALALELAGRDGRVAESGPLLATLRAELAAVRTALARYVS